MAEGDGLENRCVSNGTGGSNPSPSALVCVATLCCAMSRHFFVHLVCRRWGDAICFNELHHTTPYHNTWD